MTDASASGASVRLYSQTDHDERGNFHYEGDLYRPREPFATLARRIEDHLTVNFNDMRVALSTKTFSGGRSITVEILDCPTDLSDRETRDAMIIAVRDQIERFGFTRANPLQDYHSCSFYTHVNVGRAYWSALAERRGVKSGVDALVSLAAFKRQVKPGDQMKLAGAPGWNKMIGTTRTIIAVRSKDLVLEGPSYLDFPRVAQFACDGKLVRIAIGTEHDRHAYLLYHWIRQQAE